MPPKNDALATLATQAETLPEPYLIAGPQAAYIYHCWLQPISKMVDVCIPAEKKGLWQAALRPPEIAALLIKQKDLPLYI